MAEQGLTRALPGKFVLAVVVGGVIGLGILRGPGEIAEVIRDPFLYLGLWLLGGLFVLLSTVVGAELVGMTPRSGGTYSLIRRAFGPYPGFVIALYAVAMTAVSWPVYWYLTRKKKDR